MRQLFTRTLLSVAAASLLLTACGGNAPAPAPTPAASSSSAAAAPTPPPADPAPTASAPADTVAAAPATGATAIGIAECDDFLKVYESCVADKVPAEARSAMQTGIQQWRDSWAQLAANEATKGSLAQACVQARESSKQALAAYGCSL
jgi:hypothetical protein